MVLIPACPRRPLQLLPHQRPICLPREDRLLDVRCQPCQPQNPADVALREFSAAPISLAYTPSCSISCQRHARASALTSVPPRFGFGAGAATHSGVMISFRLPRAETASECAQPAPARKPLAACSKLRPQPRAWRGAEGARAPLRQARTAAAGSSKPAAAPRNFRLRRQRMLLSQHVARRHKFSTCKNGRTRSFAISEPRCDLPTRFHRHR